jgi:hypothetical protein
MSGNTAYFNIQYPSSSDYVKDGATAIQTVATGFDSAVAIPTYNAQTGTTYTFALSDIGKTVTASNAASSTYTIPPQASVVWVANTTLTVTNLGAGVVTFAGGAGVTVTNTTNTLAQYQSARLIRTGSNAWTVVPTSGIATSPGLTLVKTQTIGSAVSSINVTGAFSTTYNNYKILISGGVASITANMTLVFGATATGYYYAQNGTTFSNTGVSAGIANFSSFAAVTRSTTSAITANIEVEGPFLANATVVRYSSLDVNTAGSISYGSGFINNNNSYTDFTIAPTSGTYTGGTIYVYGYNK